MPNSKNWPRHEDEMPVNKKKGRGRTLFKAIDNTIESVDIMAYVVSTMKFLPENIKLDDDLFAAEEAYKLVLNKGLTFRKAYQQIASKYKK